MSYPGIFHDAPYLPHFDDKLGRYFNFGARNIKGFSLLGFYKFSHIWGVDFDSF